MKAVSLFGSASVGIVCVGLLSIHASADARGPESIHAVHVSPGWNLLSLPADVSNASLSALFPSAISPAYTFSPTGGYEERDTIAPGIGFWLKFATAETVLISGTDSFRDSIPCQAGWNIIGSISLPVDTGLVVTEPPGLITSGFFQYVQGAGYLQAATLRPGAGYWVKMREAGSIVLASLGGQPCPGTPTVFHEGKTYHTVLIGSQCWLRENLDVGTMVLGGANQTNNGIIEKYCYNDSVANCNTYGGMYQWNEAMQYDTSQGVQGICPPGWHLPTLADFQTLSATVGGDGNALKAVGQGTGAGAGTNTSGFSALLAGYRSITGPFGGRDIVAGIWSSTRDGPNTRLAGLYESDANFDMDPVSRSYGVSIRCLRDEIPIGSPCPGLPTVDYAGKIYNTVQIGSQCWLKENLDVGTMILGSQNQSDNDTIEKYCYYDVPAYCDTFGGLYQWNEAMHYDTTAGVRGICPPGWHMPTLGEFQTLSSTVSEDGNALKEIGQGTGGGAGTNTSGFSALLAGSRSNEGDFGYLGIVAYLWASTPDYATLVRYLSLSEGDAYVFLSSVSKNFGHSVRCLKDEVANQPPNAPGNPAPPDVSAGQSPSVMLGWSSSDPDGDPLAYDVYFGTVNPPDTMVSSN
jgi:uncharacterized protein (TIGR02145 family)